MMVDTNRIGVEFSLFIGRIGTVIWISMMGPTVGDLFNGPGYMSPTFIDLDLNPVDPLLNETV